ncbi:DUF6482 family protein [Hahella ganghwensis]|uniref:DUF6482 family protein n=1 Tax=Hahella ganghwensis TaxID=286420 RepID=UPI00036E0166|nr:DUF6482 family protein [Hahella ganghwensis]
MNIADLRRHPENINQVNILSFEGDIYIAELEYKDHRDVLQDVNGGPRRFHSIAELKEVVGATGIDRFNLVFNSPYDEI